MFHSLSCMGVRGRLVNSHLVRSRSCGGSHMQGGKSSSWSKKYGNWQFAALPLLYWRKLGNVSDRGCPKNIKEANLFATGGNSTGWRLWVFWSFFPNYHSKWKFNWQLKSKFHFFCQKISAETGTFGLTQEISYFNAEMRSKELQMFPWE